MSDPLPFVAFPLTFLFIVAGIVALTYQLSQNVRVRLPRRVLLGMGGIYMAALLVWIGTWMANDLSPDASLVFLLLLTGGLFLQATYPFWRHASKSPSA